MENVCRDLLQKMRHNFRKLRRNCANVLRCKFDQEWLRWITAVCFNRIWLQTHWWLRFTGQTVYFGHAQPIRVNGRCARNCRSFSEIARICKLVNKICAEQKLRCARSQFSGATMSQLFRRRGFWDVVGGLIGCLLTSRRRLKTSLMDSWLRQQMPSRLTSK